MKYGVKLILAALLPILLVLALLLFVVMPQAALSLHGGQNRLRFTVSDETGASISNAVVRFKLRQEVPLIPLPFAPTRFIERSRSAVSDVHGAAEVKWPNMSLTALAVSVEGDSIPIQSGAWSGSVVAPTPDGKSTWDVGTNYTARIIVDRSNHVATVR